MLNMKDTHRFPIGFWNYVPIAEQDASAVADGAQAGMTLTMGPQYGPGKEDTDRMRDCLAGSF